MDSKEVTSSPLSGSPSGSSPIKTLSDSDSQFENSVKINGSNVDSKVNNNTGGGGAGSVVSSDDDGGFESGEEDFETASERLVSIEETIGEGNEEGDEAFVDSSEFPVPKAESPTLTPPVLADDVEKVENIRVSLEKQEQGDGSVLGRESVVVEGVDSGSNVAVTSDSSPALDVKDGKVSVGGDEEDDSKLDSDSNSNFNGKVKEEILEGEEKEKVNENSIASGSSGKETGLKFRDEGVENSTLEAQNVEIPVIAVESAEVSDEPTHDTAQGDFNAETSLVGVLKPGVAVVTNMELEGGESRVLNWSDQVEHVDEPGSLKLDINGEKLNNEEDPVVESTVAKTKQLEEDGVQVMDRDSETEQLDPAQVKDVDVDTGKDAPSEAGGSVDDSVTEEIQSAEATDPEVETDEVADSADKEDQSDLNIDEVADHVYANSKSDALENSESVKVDLVSDEETDGMIFGSSEAAKQAIEELERGSDEGINGQMVTDTDEEEVETDEEGEGKELFDATALAALLKAATGGGGSEGGGGNITITSHDGSRLFTVERPAGLGSSLQSLRPAPRSVRANLFNPSSLASGSENDDNLTDEEKNKLQKLQSIRVKFLRLVHRLGLSSDESVAAQVLYRLALLAGRQTGQLFSLDAAKRKALELENEGKEDLDFSVNILVLGKSGVGKSATINSIFGEEKAIIHAFQPATTAVKEISGKFDGVKVKIFDTPGLRTSMMDQGFNRSVLSSAKWFTKKNPADIVLYVDRLDAQTRDLNDLPLMRNITSSLGSSIWRSAIVTLTHAAAAPPDGPSGFPLSYEVFVTQRSHVVQQCIGQAVGDLRMMSPSLMNPVSLVENHPSCRKNRAGQKILPNGQSWRPQLLLLCYSMKILSEANSLSKPQDPFDHRKLFGFRVRSPPLPYMLSSMLQSRAHPKLSSEQGGENGDSDVDLDLSDSEQEEGEDEYDQLPPFKPLRKSQLAKLSKEQRNAYYEEYDYRVKLLQKKQWREEVKRFREMKKKSRDPTAAANDYGYVDEEGDAGAPAPVAVPLPDMVLPPSFDGDNPAYRFRFLEPTSQFLARPVLDTHGWDHDCGYDGVNVEQSLAILGHYATVVNAQITKDKKDFTINLDSSISTKHGENGSSMVGFDIQPIGKQLAYVIRGETKMKNLKKNKTAAGISVTFLGENVVTGVKIEDQISIGRQYALVGSVGTVRFQSDSALGANIEVQRRELDYPIGQVQSTFGLSIIKWRGDLALGFNGLSQFSVGRGSKVAVRAGINNKMSGQITIRTSSSEHLSLALASVIPAAIAIYKKLWPDIGEKYSIY